MNNIDAKSRNATESKHKLLGAIFLLSGTAIGSGMISLPMVLAKFGILNTILIMPAFAALTYFTAIIRADLNLRAPASVSLMDVGKAFNCKAIGACGDFMLTLLHFSLMAAYICGGASVINSFCKNAVEPSCMILLFAFAIWIVFIFAPNIVVHINKFLFTGMFGILMFLITALLFQTPIKIVPEQTSEITFKEWTTLVPVIFTSFGFQGAIHSITKFCDNNPKTIKRACAWGSIIPATVYIVWTAAILLVVANTDAEFFNLMVSGEAKDVGHLIKVLSVATSAKSIQLIVWIVSTLAILTSILGVGLSLLDLDFFKILARGLNVAIVRIISTSFIVFVPAVVSIFIPGAFIRILNVAGIILALMAIIAPTIISFYAQRNTRTENGAAKLNNNGLVQLNKATIGLVFICGLAIILLGITDMFC